MTKGGRRRRSEERPDTEFGKALKAYVRRIEGFTQKQLAEESIVAEGTISRIVKGEREPTRDHVRAIIKALYHRKVLLTLDEANALMLTIPKSGALDKRDVRDREIIDLFDPPVTETEQAVSQGDVDDIAAVDDIVPDIVPYEQISFDNLDEDEVVAPDIVPVVHTASSTASIQDEDKVAASSVVLEPPIVMFSTPPMTHDPVLELPITPPTTHDPVPVLIEPLARETNHRRWRHAGSILAAFMLILGTVLFIARQIPSTASCSADTHGVTLYTDSNYQGQCHTFGPGDYELATYGLEEKVSSIRDPNAAFHITLFAKDKSFDYIDKDMPILPAGWDKHADTIHIEKHRPTSCHPGTNGIIAFIDPDYSGGCLFITGDIPDLTPSNFDSVIVSIQFVGSYQNTRQLVIYSQPNYKRKCGTYWQDQSDLEQCARLAVSVQVLPFTPPTPIPTAQGTHFAGNIAPQATLFPANAGAVVDGNLHTEWIGGHMVGLEFHWNFPVTIHRVVVWDRAQSPTDNNQINKLKLVFSDGTATGSIDMISEGPRCADITLPPITITWLHIVPVDASGSNGYREVEVWATTGPQYSNNNCVNKQTVWQTVPQE